MKYKEARPFAEPKAAAMELLPIFRAAIAAKNNPDVTHIYAGITNHESVCTSRASVPEWSLGTEYGTSQGWWKIDGGGRIFISETAPSGLTWKTWPMRSKLI